MPTRSLSERKASGLLPFLYGKSRLKAALGRRQRQDPPSKDALRSSQGKRVGHPKKRGPNAGWKPFETLGKPALRKKEKQIPRASALGLTTRGKIPSLFPR